MAAPPAPRFSVLTPVGTPPPAQLRACLASVRAQTLGDWEHVLAADRSTPAKIAKLLAKAAAADSRVLVIDDGDSLNAATGELIALVGAADVLAVEALAEMSAAFDSDDDVDVAYSDHDFIDADGFYVDAVFKPDFSPERLRAHNYVGSLLVARRDLAEAAGGFTDDPHDFVLRVTERARRVAHVPRVMYHLREASGGRNGSEPVGRGERAVADHCTRVGIDAIVEPTAHEGCYRVVRRVSDRPLVSIVIPTGGASGRVWGVDRCYVVDAVRSLVEKSTYRELEFVVVHDAETPPQALDAVARLGGASTTLVAYDAPFNFSAKVNLGVSAASGDLLLLLNDDTELIEPDSVEVLVGHVQEPDVAMAGAKLLFADGRLQHGGIVNSLEPDHMCVGWRGDSPGPLPLRPLAIERECSGVTAACALVRRAAFDEVGAFTTELPLNYNDVDFCLKLRAAGYRIVWTPFAQWYHFESRTRVSRVLAEELAWLDARWHAELTCDPYYNPNLTPGRYDFLELPPPPGLPRREPP